MIIKKIIIYFCYFNINYSLSLSKEARSKGFVYLNEIDPTIIISPRYATPENFVGKIIDGYKKPAIILTKECAEALKKVQENIRKDGYSLVVYDAYRPQKAVNNFISWANNLTDQSTKSKYYPRVNKEKIFELGYISKRSSHSRGSTVDLTLIKKGNTLQPIKEKKCKLLDNFEIIILDDGTVDMGSSFDLFDKASHYENNLIENKFKKLRTYLKNVMEKHGFKNCTEEWWHFSLKDERYIENIKENYFDFNME